MEKPLARSIIDELDEVYLKKRKIKDIINGGGSRELRGIIDLGMQLADAMLDPENKEHPTPESKDDQEKVRAARHFLRAAMGRLRGVKELAYNTTLPDGGKNYDAVATEIDFEG
jgi:hypothetical protein